MGQEERRARSALGSVFSKGGVRFFSMNPGRNTRPAEPGVLLGEPAFLVSLSGFTARSGAGLRVDPAPRDPSRKRVRSPSARRPDQGGVAFFFFFWWRDKMRLLP